jgi:hypothetical protein
LIAAHNSTKYKLKQPKTGNFYIFLRAQGIPKKIFTKIEEGCWQRKKKSNSQHDLYDSDAVDESLIDYNRSIHLPINRFIDYLANSIFSINRLLNFRLLISIS